VLRGGKYRWNSQEIHKKEAKKTAFLSIQKPQGPDFQLFRPFFFTEKQGKNH